MSPKDSQILIHTRLLNHHYIIYTSSDTLILNEFTNEDLKRITSPSSSQIELQAYPLPHESIVSFTTVQLVHFGLSALLIITQCISSTNIHIVIGPIDTCITLVLKIDSIFNCTKIVHKSGYILLLKGNTLNFVFISKNNELIFNEFILESLEYFNFEVINKSGNEFPIEIKFLFKEKVKENNNKRIIGEHIYRITKLNNNNGNVNSNITRVSPGELNLSDAVYNIHKKKEDCKDLKELNFVCKDKSIQIGLTNHPNEFFAEIRNNCLIKYNADNKNNEEEEVKTKTKMVLKHEIKGLKRELLNSINNMENIIVKYEKELKEKNEFLNL